MPVFAHVPAHTNKRPTSWKLFCFVCLQQLKLFFTWQPVAQSCWKHCLDPSFCCGLLKANKEVNEMPGLGLRGMVLRQASWDNGASGLLPAGAWPISRDIAKGCCLWGLSGDTCKASMDQVCAFHFYARLILSCSYLMANWYSHFVEEKTKTQRHIWLVKMTKTVTELEFKFWFVWLQILCMFFNRIIPNVFISLLSY